MSKKVEKLLKGVAVTGASVAGASMFGDGSMAYAAEVGLEDTLVDQTEVVVDLETTLEENQQQLGLGAEEPTINVELSENDTLDSLTAALDEYEDQLEDIEESYEEKGYNHEGLDDQQTVVQEKLDAEKAKRESLTNLNTQKYYTDYARPLAVEMVKYKLLQDGVIDANNVDAMQYEWFGNKYEEKHLLVKYIGTDLQYHEEYYDYVTADADGNSIFQDGTKINGIQTEDYAPNVSGINVLVKHAVFAETPSPNKTYTIDYTDADGKVTTMTGARYQRTDFLPDEETGRIKGGDWYKTIQYLADVAERLKMQEDKAQLEQDIKTTEAKMMLVTSVISTVADVDIFGGLTDDTPAAPAVPAPQTVEIKAEEAPTAPVAQENIASTVSVLSSAGGENHISHMSQAAEEAAAVEQPVSVAEEAVPLAVIEDDNVVGTSANRIIAEEDVAKGHVTEMVQRGRQGLFYGIIAAISSIFAFGKLDEKTAKERK